VLKKNDIIIIIDLNNICDCCIHYYLIKFNDIH